MLIAMVLAFSGAAFADCNSPANKVVRENCLAGNASSEWDISGSGDTTIQGFATDISVNAGQTVTFKIQTPASRYSINIYRMGYYGGMGARKVASITPSATLPQAQPACLTDSATKLMDCGNWAVSASWVVPSTAVSGIYFARLTRTDTNGASHIFFIVRDDSSHSAVLFQTADETWQAYNNYGGFSVYGDTNFNLPARATKISYNRPFKTRTFESLSWVFHAEYPMVRWLEANGYDVTYFTCVDAVRNGTLITNHHLYLSVGHDEYWSGPHRANVEAALSAGVNLAFFSGNEVFWKTRWENSIDGTNTPYRTLVCYKETLGGVKSDPADPPAWTGTWRDPRFSPPADGGRPENTLTGTLFMVNGPSSDNVNLSIKVPAADGLMRFWRNTSIATLPSGQVATLPAGTLGYEWDADIDNGLRPAGLVSLSTSTYALTTDLLLDYGGTYGAGFATHHMTLYRAPSGALVFGAGTIQWSWGLDSNHDDGGSGPDVRMQQATVNLFADMGVQPASIQSGLFAATQTTDTNPPVSTIMYPAAGATVASRSGVTISGTATDYGGGVVGGVEVSVDGGQSWHPTVGRGNWSYSWAPKSLGSATIKTRAVDDSGNIEAPSPGISVTVVAPDCPCAALGASAPQNPDSGDGSAIEVGVKFRTDFDGYITGVRFYKAAANTGTHTGNLWSSAGALMGSATFTGETASGWQQVSFSNVIPVTANTTYIASYFAPLGHYSADYDRFATSGLDSPPVHLLAAGVSGPNGVYAYNPASTFPSSSSNSTSYWVDVVYIPASTMPGTAPGLLAVPINVSFLAFRGLGNPPAQTISVYNEGSGTMNWTATKSAAWLVAPASGTTPASPSISINSAGLSTGTYTGTVTFNASGSNAPPQVIAVTLTVTNLLMSSSFQSSGFEGWSYSPLGLASNWSVNGQSAQYNGGGHTQIYAGNSAWADYDVQADIQLTSLSDYPGGVRGRLNPATGAGYAAWLYPAEGQVRLFKNTGWNINTGLVQLGQAAASFDTVKLHTLKLSFRGSQIQVFYDAKLLMTVSDTANASGVIALDVSSQVVNFTNVQVTAPVPAPVTLGVSSSTVNFSAMTPGANPAPQTVQVTGTGGGSLVFTAVSTGPWLTVTPLNGLTGASLQLSADMSQLTPGTYNASVRVRSLAAGNSPLTVNVGFTVTAVPPAIVPAPTSLAFTATAGQAAPAPQSLVIGNGGYGAFSWTASTDSPWLSVSPGSGSTPGSLTVNATPTGLAPGSYTGNVILTSPGVGNSPKSVPVTLALNALLLSSNFAGSGLEGWVFSPLGLASNWSVSANSVLYNGNGQTQLYAGNSAWTDYDVQADIKLSSLSDYPGGIRGRVDPSTGAGYALWLYPAEGVVKLFKNTAWNINTGLTQLGQAPATFDTINFHTVKLSFRGTQVQVFFDARLLLTVSDPSNANGLVALDVSSQPVNFTNVLVIAPAAAPASLVPSSSTLSFSAQTPGANPAAQTVQLTSTPSGSLAFTSVSTAPWLSATLSGGATAATLQAAVDVSLLAPGSYSGAIRVTSLGATNSPQLINVSVTVTAVPPAIAATPSSLGFASITGQPNPPAQTLAIRNGGYGAFSWTATTDSPWLTISASSGSTPLTLNVTADPTGLAPGTYMGNVVVSAAGVANSPQSVPVSLSVRVQDLNEDFSDKASGWVISPMRNDAGWTVLNGVYSYNGAGLSQSCAGNAAWADYTFDTNVQLASLSNWPGGVRGRVNPNTGAGYALWLYPGTGQAVLYRVPQWDINGSGVVALAQAPLSFDTAAHDLKMNFSGSSISVFWDGNPVLSATDSSFASGFVCMDGDSQPISYSNIVVAAAQNALTLAATPTALTFASAPGAAPASQTVSVSAGGASTTWGFTSSAAWLSASLSSTLTPGVLTVSADPTGLAEGTYSGTLTLSAPGATNSPVVIPVTFSVKTAALTVAPASLTFFGSTTTNPAAQSIAISNAGTGTLAWSASKDSAWIGLSSASGTAPASLSITPNASSLAVGAYNGNATISSTDAGNGSAAVAVALQVGTLNFFDDFSNGAGNWTISPLGNAAGWTVANGMYNYNGGGHTQVWAGSSSWTDYTMAADVQLASLSDYPGGLRGRVNTTTGSGYGLWIYPAEGILKLYRIGQWNIDSGFALLAQSNPMTMDTNRHNLRLVFRGSVIQVYYDNALAIQVSDSTYTQGAIAFDVSNQPISYANATVIGF